MDQHGPAASVVLASAKLRAGKGGKVAAAGVILDVPPKTLAEDSEASIRRVATGYDVHIDGSWHGHVRVTIPLANSRDAVMHQVGGLWVPEGGRLGQPTVTVSSLSVFSTLSTLGSKVAEAACFTFDIGRFVTCLIDKGMNTVSKKALTYLIQAVVHDKCAAHLLAQLNSMNVAIVYLSTFRAMFTGPCVGTAGDPTNWQDHVSPSPQTSQGRAGGAEGDTPTSSPSEGSAATEPGHGAQLAPGTGRVMIQPCLNLRSGPGGTTALVGCVPNGAVITIDCTSQGAAVTGPYGSTTLWDHTIWNGLTGFVSDAFIYTGTPDAVAGTCATGEAPGNPPAPVEPSPPNPAAPPSATGSILIDPCLNLRQGPEGGTALIGCIPKGTVIGIECTAQGNPVTGPYGTTTLWDRTTWNGLTGFVSDAFVYTGTANAVAVAC